jgi:hypothetical protein
MVEGRRSYLRTRKLVRSESLRNSSKMIEQVQDIDK